MTVTDTTAVITWETDEPADTVLRYGPHRDRLDTAARGDGRATRFHGCELRGLRPGTVYHFRCGEQAADIADGNPCGGSFRTLVPPPGELLFAFATMTDLHIGQQRVARVAVRGKVVSEGIRWREPGLAFWQLTVGAAIDEINAGDAAFTIVKGDIADAGSVEWFSTARRLLDGLTRPYHVARGNHDALNPLLRAFGLPRSWYSFDHQGIHFVVLDTESFATAQDPDRERQLAWLAEDLRAARGRWTLVFGHRPILPLLTRTAGEAWTEDLLYFGEGLARRWYGDGAVGAFEKATGRRPQVSTTVARRLAGLFRSHGRIAGVFAGHLHRNYVGSWPEETGNLPYVETASTKEYPCGYAITRVCTGGYMQSYHTPLDPRCLEWSAMTRDAYARLGWQSKAGATAERNFVVRFDAINLRPAVATTRGAVGSGKP